MFAFATFSSCVSNECFCVEELYFVGRIFINLKQLLILWCEMNKTNILFSKQVIWKKNIARRWLRIKSPMNYITMKVLFHSKGKRAINHVYVSVKHHLDNWLIELMTISTILYSFMYFEGVSNTRWITVGYSS